MEQNETIIHYNQDHIFNKHIFNNNGHILKF